MIPALSEAFLLRHVIGPARFCELGGGAFSYDSIYRDGMGIVGMLNE